LTSVRSCNFGTIYRYIHIHPPPPAGDGNANNTTNDSTTHVTQPPTFDALSNHFHWRRGPLFARSDALALILSFEEDNQYNSIFSGLLGVEFQLHVPHAIELIQGILSIESHDWRHPNQIPSTTDLSSLPGMFQLLPITKSCWIFITIASTVYLLVQEEVVEEETKETTTVMMIMMMRRRMAQIHMILTKQLTM
jgi:hypothetical protein